MRNATAVLDRLVEPLTDAVRLRVTRLGARMVDVLDGQVQLVLVMLQRAAELHSTVGQDAQEGHLLLLEPRNGAVVEQVGRHQGVLAVVQLDEGDFAVGIDEGLLVDAATALDVPDVVGVLGAEIARMGRLDSPSASRCSLAFSNAASCASVRIRLWFSASRRSKAARRFWKVSRLCRSQIDRTPPGDTKMPRFFSALDTRFCPWAG